MDHLDWTTLLIYTYIVGTLLKASLLCVLLQHIFVTFIVKTIQMPIFNIGVNVTHNVIE